MCVTTMYLIYFIFGAEYLASCTNADFMRKKEEKTTMFLFFIHSHISYKRSQSVSLVPPSLNTCCCCSLIGRESVVTRRTLLKLSEQRK